MIVPVLLAPLLAGCAVTSRSRSEAFGTPVGPATLERIPEGPGGAAWVEAVLGPPDARCPADAPPGAERWTWVAGTRETGGGSVLIIGGRTDREKRVVTELLVHDGTVLEAEQRHERGSGASG